MNYNVTVNGKVFEVEVELVKKSYAPVSRTPQQTEVKPAETIKESAPVKAAESKSTGNAVESVVCPMPGSILKLNVTEGASVKAGDTLLTLEAMKMENEITCAKSGVVKSIPVKKGDYVEAGDVLVVIG